MCELIEQIECIEQAYQQDTDDALRWEQEIEATYWLFEDWKAAHQDIIDGEDPC